MQQRRVGACASYQQALENIVRRSMAAYQFVFNARTWHAMSNVARDMEKESGGIFAAHALGSEEGGCGAWQKQSRRRAYGGGGGSKSGERWNGDLSAAALLNSGDGGAADG